MGLVAFLATIAYYPGASGSGISPKWWVVALGCAVALAFLRLRPQVEWFFGAMFLGYAALSLSWTPEPIVAANELVHLLVLALAFLVGSALRDLRAVFRGLAVGIGVNGVLALAQWLWATMQPGVPLVPWFDQVSPDPRYPAGLFVNHNFLAETAALALAGSLAYRDWRFTVPSALTLCLVHSRAALLALAALGLFRATRAYTFWLGLLLAVPAIVLMYYMGADNAGVADRLSFWSQVIGGISVTGSGLGSYQVTFYTAEHAHNDLLQMVFELGVGIVPLCALVWCAVRGSGAECSVLGVALVLALFSFPLELPTTGFIIALTLGHLCTCSSELRVARLLRGGDNGARDRRVAPGSGALDW